MRKRWVWGLICLLLCLLPACGQEKPAANDVPPASESPVEAAPQKREADFSAAFGGIQGCAVLYDPGTDQWTFYQEEMCRQRVSPCSTFKIVSTLMGLHTGVLSGPESTMTYSGLTYPVAAWNQNLTLEQAFQSSCVWYFRQVIDFAKSSAVALPIPLVEPVMIATLFSNFMAMPSLSSSCFHECCSVIPCGKQIRCQNICVNLFT